MEKFFVYIIFSASHDIFYKGFTSNVERRLEQHNNNKGRFTANKGPWELVYLEECDSKRNALIREKSLKKQNRKYLIWLIQQDYNLV